MIELKNNPAGNFFLLAGPCVIEGEEMAMRIAERVVGITEKLQIPYVFKGSYRKANRSRLDSFTGIGDEKALKVLKKVRDTFGVPTVTDIHSANEAEMAAEYADILQIPAFLCRQTDLLVAAAKTGKTINIKKGQFLSPLAMQFAADKVVEAGNKNVMLTELIGNLVFVPQIHKVFTLHICGKTGIFFCVLIEISVGDNFVVDRDNDDTYVFHSLTVIVNCGRRSIYRNAPKRIVLIGSVSVSVVTETRIDRRPHVAQFFLISRGRSLCLYVGDKAVVCPFLEMTVVYENDIDLVIRRKRASGFNTLYVNRVRKELGHTQRQVVLTGVFRLVESLNHCIVLCLLLVVTEALHYDFGSFGFTQFVITATALTSSEDGCTTKN